MRTKKQIERRRAKQNARVKKQFALREGFYNSSPNNLENDSMMLCSKCGFENGLDRCLCNCETTLEGYFIQCGRSHGFADSLEQATVLALNAERERNHVAIITGPDGRRYRIGSTLEPRSAEYVGHEGKIGSRTFRVTRSGNLSRVR